MVVDQIEINTQ